MLLDDDEAEMTSLVDVCLDLLLTTDVEKRDDLWTFGEQWLNHLITIVTECNHTHALFSLQPHLTDIMAVFEQKNLYGLAEQFFTAILHKIIPFEQQLQQVDSEKRSSLEKLKRSVITFVYFSQIRQGAFREAMKSFMDFNPSIASSVGHGLPSDLNELDTSTMATTMLENEHAYKWISFLLIIQNGKNSVYKSRDFYKQFEHVHAPKDKEVGISSSHITSLYDAISYIFVSSLQWS